MRQTAGTVTSVAAGANMLIRKTVDGTVGSQPGKKAKRSPAVPDGRQSRTANIAILSLSWIEALLVGTEQYRSLVPIISVIGSFQPSVNNLG